MAYRCGWLALAVCGVAFSSSFRLCAQIVAPDSGARVRVGRINETTLQEGSFVSATPDSFSLSPGYGLGAISIPISSIQSLDVSRGRHVLPGRVLKDVAVGGAAGLASAAVVTAVACAASKNGSNVSGDGGVPCALGFFFLAIPLTVVGGGIGAWIGAEHPVDDWKRVYDRGLSTGLIMGPTRRGGLAIGMSVAFGGASDTR